MKRCFFLKWSVFGVKNKQQCLYTICVQGRASTATFKGLDKGVHILACIFLSPRERCSPCAWGPGTWSPFTHNASSHHFVFVCFPEGTVPRWPAFENYFSNTNHTWGIVPSYINKGHCVCAFLCAHMFQSTVLSTSLGAVFFMRNKSRPCLQ